MLNGEELPGYKKKSFVLPYNGGEIWFEHLDGIYEHEALVLQKLEKDVPIFSRPSSTAFVCFVFDETIVTDNILGAVSDSILKTGKRFMKIAFVGLDKANVRKFKRELTGNGFAVGFFKGLEDAKEWLISE
ncbi:MAG: hypothetical protein ACI4RG_08960 [Huintestinicola sp.]